LKIILLISENREITDNITKYKPKNLDLVVIKTEKYLRHYLEEYLPEYVIVNIFLENHFILNEYAENNPKSTIFFSSLEKPEKIINKNFIFIKDIKSKENIKDIIDVIARIEIESNINPEHSFKLINQQIISVYSLKGGTGKTTIAFNLAYFLKKLLDARVILLDLNLIEGPSDLSSYLKTNQIPNLNYYIENYDGGEDALKKSLILKKSEDIDVLLPPLSLAQGNNLNSSLLNKLINLIKGFYNFIIIDLPLNFTQLTLEAINLSDSLVIVSLPIEACALKLSKFKLKNISLKIQNKISIINNPYNFSSISKNDFEKITKLPVLLEIPHFENKNKKFLNFRNNATDLIDMEHEIKQLINKYLLT